MQTSDQSPEKQPMASHPLPEQENLLSPEIQDERNHTQHKQDTPGSIGVNDEAIRQGLIYPPPPSFYQKEQPAASIQTNTTAQVQAPSQPQEPPHAYGGPAEYIPQQQPVNSIQQASYSPPPVHPPYPIYPPGQGYPGMQAPYFPPPVAKKSYKWVWILVSALGVLLLATCGICVWASSSLLGNPIQQASSIVYGSRDITNNYYEAIQGKHYSQAYNYLSTQQSLKNLTLDQYLKQAQDLDTRYGPVYKYVPGSPVVGYNTSNTTIDHFTITVDVTREKKSYQAMLTMYKIDGQWKITDYTTI